ncbi:MAG: hypothetical protein H6905_02620 [Hyphomicrobiales bacterium]|nr:hypothetical protein [Hyphomicrobiales bacterium]
MTQHDLDVDNGSGQIVRLDFNAGLQALASLMAGASPPSPSYPNMFWLDTSASPSALKMRNATNTGWFVLGEIAGDQFFPFRNGVAIAEHAVVDGIRFSSTIATPPTATGTDSLAIGDGSDTSNADHAIAIGSGAAATANNALAIGPSVTNGIADTVRIGVSAATYLQLDAAGVLSLAGSKPAFVIPVYATTDRPSTPSEGMLVFDSDLGEALFHQGGAWLPAGPKPYDIAAFVEGTMDDGETVVRHVAARAFSLPADMTGSVLTAGSAATAETIVSCEKDGVQFGTITVAASATSGTFTAATETSFAVGDVLTIEGPATADASLADIAITLKGTRV